MENNGLKTAFQELAQAQGGQERGAGYCGLGSVKTNIGHLELAAGIAGVIKVLLQLKHKTVVKSLHCQTINPYIMLKDSPFYIARETEQWKPLQDSQGMDLPRRAGVSSFGFGGANAHVVIEEYVEKSGAKRLPAEEVGTCLVVLSAKSEDQLRVVVNNLRQFILEPGTFNLSDLSYTLQVGREAMEERLALVVTSFEDLEDKLKGFLEDGDMANPALPIPGSS